MTPLAATLEAFFKIRLTQQRRASSHTVNAYRDTFRLLFHFVHERTGRTPAQLQMEDLDATVIGDFLTYLEEVRGNTVRTRNSRLAAIHSFFRFASYRHPEHILLIQRVQAIPRKKFNRQIVTFLTESEAEALLAATPRESWIGRRDRALLLLALQTGLRVAELTSLTWQDVALEGTPQVHCQGKGRKQRQTPLRSSTIAVLRAWRREMGGRPGEPVFPSMRGQPLTTDAVEALVLKYARAAALVLDRMVSWLAPGGWLLLEEPDFGIWMADADPVWSALGPAWNKTFPNGCLSRGRSLLKQIRHLGLVDVGADSELDIIQPGTPLAEFYQLSMAAIGPALVHAGALTAKETADLIDRPAQADLLCGFAHIGVWGRRPHRPPDTP